MFSVITTTSKGVEPGSGKVEPVPLPNNVTVQPFQQITKENRPASSEPSNASQVYDTDAADLKFIVEDLTMDIYEETKMGLNKTESRYEI